MTLRFSHVYAILTAIALCYLAVTGYAAENTLADGYGPTAVAESTAETGLR